MVHDMIQETFKRFTASNDFTFSRTEFFTNFSQRDLPHVKNKALTLLSKLLIKYIWDCRNMAYIPNLENCFEILCGKIVEIMKCNGNFNNTWRNSGLLNPENINVIP